MIRPLTVGECDAQLVRLREQYLAAEQHLEFDLAFNLWTELQRLLDMRIRMPHPRISPENGGAPCTDCPSTGSAPQPSSSA